jgi:uncharacterized protein YjbI with pentapeptide repeats
VLGAISLIAGLAGVIDGPVPYLPVPGLRHFHVTIGPELIGIGLTVLLIDVAQERLATQQRKKQLILQMGSPANAFAVEAARQLGASRWGFGKDTSLHGADLWGTDLQGADLMSVNLEGARLADAKLQKADLRSAHLRGANLHGAKLQGAKLAEADLREATLMDAELQGVDTDLSGANLKDANLCYAKFHGTQMRYTDLEGTQFWEAELQGADLTGASLLRADLYKAKLEKAMITDEQLAHAWKLVGATMPDGVIYDGFLNLRGDIEWARESGVDTDNTTAMREWYMTTSKASITVEVRQVTKREEEYMRRQVEKTANGRNELDQLMGHTGEVHRDLKGGHHSQ